MGWGHIFLQALRTEFQNHPKILDGRGQGLDGGGRVPPPLSCWQPWPLPGARAAKNIFFSALSYIFLNCTLRRANHSKRWSNSQRHPSWDRLKQDLEKKHFYISYLYYQHMTPWVSRVRANSVLKLACCPRVLLDLQAVHSHKLHRHNLNNLTWICCIKVKL